MSIRNHLIVIEEYDGFFPEGEEISFYQELMEFYDQRHHKPIWSEGESFQNNPQELIQEIKNSYSEGLKPSDYHLEIINQIMDNPQLFTDDFLDQRALLDILLTDAYLSLASDYLNGKINAEIIVDDYDYRDDQLEAQKLLNLLFEEKNISKILEAQLPKSDNYTALRKKLYLYRDSGKIDPWPKIESGETLGVKAEGERVNQLIENLLARNYLSSSQFESRRFFGENVKRAVAQFQMNNGLNADGVVGKKTLNALNLSREYRIKQLIINMERWRWLPEDLGQRYIYVNIADYNLKLFVNNQLKMEMKTIVGREQRSTPVFSDTIDYLVLNPYWYVPESIAVKDILPEIKKDQKYLEENNFSLFQYTGNNKLEEIDPDEVEWNQINEENFNYLIRQNPGNNNSLGRVKFMFPNKFSVYLHDTPGKYLFSKNQRNFSSGCIRIEKPVDLAEYLLNDQEEWTRNNIEEEMKKDTEKIIYLNNPIKIYLQYNTAWVNHFGNLNFREDIYNRDQKIMEAYF